MVVATYDDMHMKKANIEPWYWIYPTYLEVKDPFSEESKENVREGDINNDNDEYLYLLLGYKIQEDEVGRVVCWLGVIRV